MNILLLLLCGFICSQDSELNVNDIYVQLRNESMQYSFNYTHDNGTTYKIPPKLSPVHISGVELYLRLRPKIESNGKIIYKSSKLCFVPKDVDDANRNMGVDQVIFQLRCFPTPDLKKWQEALQTIKQLKIDGNFGRRHNCALWVEYNTKLLNVCPDITYISNTK